VIDELYQIWGIKPEHVNGDKFTGYESLYPEFDKFTEEVYDKDPEGTRKQILELYRSINLVPMYYYTEQGLHNEIVELRDKHYNNIENDILSLGNNSGQTINRFLFPNMLTALPKGRIGNSLRDRFLHDTKLDRAIRICFEHRSGNKLVYPTAIRRALELVTGENIQNFKSQHARAITEYLCPSMFGRVYDYSSGYGGRMLGTSLSNMRYTYIGIDPNTETFKYLNYLSKLCNTNIELYNTVSEEYQPENIDLAFSSPPYFNLEKYCDESTQCMNRYTTLDEWFDGYVVPTMKNVHAGLNIDGLFATNIADYKGIGGEFFVVDKWIKTAESLGFKYCKTIKMMLNTRPGVGNFRNEGREKFEGIYVFSK
jgi:hypothetical protein